MKQYERSFSYTNSFFPDEYKLSIGDLIQIAEVSVISGCEIVEHIQMCDEITYAISGKAKIYSGENCTEIQSGQIHFIKRGLKHRIVADDNERFRYICIGILPDYSYRDIKSFAELLDDDFFFAEDDGDVRILAELLINEFYLRDTESDIMINMYLTQIFISLARILKNGGRTISRNNIYRQNTSQHTIYNTLRYIDREYINIKSVKQIAEHLSYSEYYLSHLFKEKTLHEQRLLSINQQIQYTILSPYEQNRQIIDVGTGRAGEDEPIHRLQPMIRIVTV